MNTPSTLGRVALLLGIMAVSLAGLTPRARSEVVAAVPQDGTASPVWNDIEGDTYDQRAHFTTGINRLSARFDDQIRVLKAKRAAMTADTKDWDLAFQEVEASRTYLTGMMNLLAQQTTPETWLDVKGKVGDAWKRSQAAVDKMNATVTS
jgi:hypothetical protein